jgi:SAM-dependent methyltransferase
MDDLYGEELAANRRNWDERVGVHVASRFYDVDGWLRARPGPRPRELEALGDVSGMDLVHLQCHFGLDTLAWARVGARVTGLDFSSEAVATASDLARRADLSDRSEFVCADVLDAHNALGQRTFDVVYVSLGALCWLPSVDRWAFQVAALLRPGGRLYLHDGHPLAWALGDQSLAVEHGYFETDAPFVDDSDETYTDATRPLANRRSYEWNHGLAETVTALLDHGLRIDRLEEHDWHVHQRFPWLVEERAGHWVAPPEFPQVPLTFTVVATRAG